MVVIIFRSKLTADAGQDYADLDAELFAAAQAHPGFIAVKSYEAEDGERLSVVWWQDRETLEQWRRHARHGEAKQLGRERWYEYYRVEIAEVYRESHFDRPVAAAMEATE